MPWPSDVMEYVASYYISTMKLESKSKDNAAVEGNKDHQCTNTDISTTGQFMLTDGEKLLIDVVINFHQTVLIISEKYEKEKTEKKKKISFYNPFNFFFFFVFCSGIILNLAEGIL